MFAAIVKFEEALPSKLIDEASRVKAPELRSRAPVVVISTSAELPAMLTPPAPSRVNAPEEVVKLEAASESREIPVASIVASP